jgi:hypothetical protein
MTQQKNAKKGNTTLFLPYMQIPPPLRRQDLWSLSRNWNNYNIRKQFILWSGRSLIRKQELTRKKGLWWVQYIYGLCAASNTVKYQSTCLPLWVWCKPYGPNGEGPNCLLLCFTLLAASYSWASHLHTSPFTNVEMWSLLYNIVLCNAQGKTQMVMLIGRILTDGRMSARIKYDVNDRFSFKINAQVCFSICGHQCSPLHSPSMTDSHTIQCSCQAAYHYPLWPL